MDEIDSAIGAETAADSDGESITTTEADGEDGVEGRTGRTIGSSAIIGDDESGEGEGEEDDGRVDGSIDAGGEEDAEVCDDDTDK